jgi:hypothetical protein
VRRARPLKATRAPPNPARLAERNDNVVALHQAESRLDCANATESRHDTCEGAATAADRLGEGGATRFLSNEVGHDGWVVERATEGAAHAKRLARESNVVDAAARGEAHEVDGGQDISGQAAPVERAARHRIAGTFEENLIDDTVSAQAIGLTGRRARCHL